VYYMMSSGGSVSGFGTASSLGNAAASG